VVWWRLLSVGSLNECPELDRDYARCLCCFFIRDVMCLSLWMVRLLTFFVLDIRMLNTANGLS